MDPALKHRLIGAAVLSALAIIFLPMLIVGHDRNDTASSVPLTMPSAPGGDFQIKELPLVAPSPGVPDGGVVGMNATHPAGSAPPAAVASPAASTSGAPLPAGTQPAPAPSPPVVPASALALAPPAAPAASGVKPPATGASVVPAAPSSTTPAAAASPAATAPAVTAPATAPIVPPTAPIPAASAGGHYVVSLGTYANAGNAQSLVASLKGSQLPAYSESVTVAGKVQTRVRIGPFGQRGDAEAARLKAQQVRKDMPASVTALDAAAPAAGASASPSDKPVATVPAAAASATTKPAQAAATPTTSKSMAPAVSAATTSKLPVPAPATNAPASAAVKSPAATGRGYAVQVSAYKSEEEALTLRNKLRAAGFTAFSERVQAESGTMYRVRIGPEADRDAADKLRAELSAKMGLNGMVVGYP